MTTPPAATADHQARQSIRNRLDRTLFVEAGAGTGKTTALVDRVVALVESGVEVGHIAAITFTEAAAAELRDRVRVELERAAQAGVVPPEAARAVDDAAVSTLHAFAHRILAEHALEAGLPPSFEVHDEISSALAFEERWTAFLDELLDDPALEPYLLQGLATGLRIDDLRLLAAALGDHRDRLEAASVADAALPPVPAVEVAPVLEALEEAVALRDHCVDDGDGLARHLDEMAELADRLAASGDELEQLQVLLHEPSLRCGRGQQGHWTGCPVEEVRQACEAAEKTRTELLDRVRQPVLAALVRAVAGFTVQAAAHRRREGHLVFHDLLVEARNLLRRHPAVRSALHERWTHLLIDEFQDTDPLQVELAVLLAGGQDPGAVWPPEAPLPGGRLFFVGDAQQSIYRFRRADIALFLEVQEGVAEEVLSLTTSFRSVPGVLAYVNDVFGRLIGEGVEGAQARFQPLVATRPPLVEDGEVPVVVLGQPHEKASQDDVRRLEAADVAATVKRVLDEGWPVATDGGASPTTRPAQPGDVAILLPTRTGLAQLEEALDEAGVPYRVESGALVWRTQEVRDLLSVLAAVDDPTDEVALVAALRSPALACGDDDLLAFHQAGGRWDHRRPPPEALAPTHPVVAALAELATFHRDRWWTGPSGLVERVLRELRFFELAFAQAHPRRRDHWRRLRFVLDQARAFEEAGGTSLRQFLAWADRQATEESRVREPTLDDPEAAAVRILTVHGAKGLEFPVTVLAGLNRLEGGGDVVRVLWDRDRPEVRLGKLFETPGYAARADTEKGMEKHERLRLLYVAATRARDHLVVSVHHKAGQKSSAADLHELHQSITHRWRPLGPAPFALVPPQGRRPEPPAADAAAQRARWWADRESRLDALRRAPVMAASDLGEDGPGPDGDLRWEGRAGAGSAVGRAVHAVLQTVDLATGDGLAALAHDRALAEGIGEHADRVERLAAAALASEEVRRAATTRHWRELYVAVPMATGLLEGFVDLVYESGEGLVVVDYKTDAVATEAALAAATEHHRLQLAAYALALEATTGQPVSRAVLLFLGAGAARVRSATDLPAAKVEVVHRLEGSIA